MAKAMRKIDNEIGRDEHDIVAKAPTSASIAAQIQ